MVKIRLATKRDIDKIAKLFFEYGKYENDLDEDVEAESLGKVKEAEKEHISFGTKYILVEENGRPVGALNFDIDRRGKEKIGVLHTLIITKEARGRGYGKALVEYAFNTFKKKGCRRIRTFIHFANKNAQEFWKKQGFHLEYGYTASRRLK